MTAAPSTTPTIFHLGSDKVINDIKHAKAQGRVAQTMMLVGQAGYGALPTALSIARILLCAERPDDACGQCSACHLSNKLQHPDLHLTYPVVKPKDVTTNSIKSEDFLPAFRQFLQDQPFGDYEDWRSSIGDPGKQLNIYASMIEEIETQMAFRPHQSVAKVHLIWGAEYLGQEGNKLLKAIEEPNTNHYVILIAAHRRGILPTILSRCQHILLPKPTHQELQDKLQKLGHNVPLDSIHDFDDMHSLLSSDEASMDDRKKWLTILRMAYNQDGLGLYEILSQVAQLKSNACEQFMMSGLHLCRQLLHARVGIPLDHQTAVERLAKLTDIAHIQALSSRMEQDLIHIQRNANLRIIMISWAPFLTRLFSGIRESLAKP